MGEASFDPTGLWRYRLTRRWDARPDVAFVMLNPNRADAERDDPTIRRCVGFAKAWGYGGLVVVNLFAWRCRHPRELRLVDDPVGPDNDVFLADVRGMDVVAAWGNHGAWRGRDRDVLALLGDVACLGATKLGHPVHPLYVRKDVVRRPYVVARYHDATARSPVKPGPARSSAPR